MSQVVVNSFKDLYVYCLFSDLSYDETRKRETKKIENHLMTPDSSLDVRREAMELAKTEYLRDKDSLKKLIDLHLRHARGQIDLTQFNAEWRRDFNGVDGASLLNQSAYDRAKKLLSLEEECSKLLLDAWTKTVNGDSNSVATARAKCEAKGLSTARVFELCNAAETAAAAKTKPLSPEVLIEPFHMQYPTLKVFLETLPKLLKKDDSEAIFFRIVYFLLTGNAKEYSELTVNFADSDKVTAISDAYYNPEQFLQEYYLHKFLYSIEVSAKGRGEYQLSRLEIKAVRGIDSTGRDQDFIELVKKYAKVKSGNSFILDDLLQVKPKDDRLLCNKLDSIRSWVEDCTTDDGLKKFEFMFSHMGKGKMSGTRELYDLVNSRLTDKQVAFQKKANAEIVAAQQELKAAMHKMLLSCEEGHITSDECQTECKRLTEKTGVKPGYINAVYKLWSENKSTRASIRAAVVYRKAQWNCASELDKGQIEQETKNLIVGAKLQMSDDIVDHLWMPFIDAVKAYASLSPISKFEEGLKWLRGIDLDKQPDLLNRLASNAYNRGMRLDEIIMCATNSTPCVRCTARDMSEQIKWRDKEKGIKSDDPVGSFKRLAAPLYARYYNECQDQTHLKEIDLLWAQAAAKCDDLSRQALTVADHELNFNPPNYHYACSQARRMVALEKLTGQSVSKSSSDLVKRAFEHDGNIHRKVPELENAKAWLTGLNVPEAEFIQPPSADLTEAYIAEMKPLVRAYELSSMSDELKFVDYAWCKYAKWGVPVETLNRFLPVYISTRDQCLSAMRRGLVLAVNHIGGELGHDSYRKAYDKMETAYSSKDAHEMSEAAVAWRSEFQRAFKA